MIKNIIFDLGNILKDKQRNNRDCKEAKGKRI